MLLVQSYDYPSNVAQNQKFPIIPTTIFPLELDLKVIHSFAPSLTQDAFHPRAITSSDLSNLNVLYLFDTIFLFCCDSNMPMSPKGLSILLF